MTRAIHVDENWPIIQWLILIALLVLAQVVLLKIFSTAPPKGRADARARSFGLLILPRESEESGKLRLGALEDPTLFSLANPRGYSGQSWLAPRTVSNRYSRWTPPDEWLPPGDISAGIDLSGVSAQNLDQLLSLAKKLPPPETGSPEVEVPQESLVTFEGELAGRGVIDLPELPSWPVADVLKPTVVRLIVRENGYPLSAALVQTNGFMEADQKALEIAYRMRFAPVEEEVGGQRKTGTAWGRAVFHWHTILPEQPESQSADP